MAKGKGKKGNKAETSTEPATTAITGGDSEPPSISEGVAGDTTTAPTTTSGATPNALADLLGSDPNAAPEDDGENKADKKGKGKKGKGKGKKGKEGKGMKGSKGKKGKKGAKGGGVEKSEAADTGPQLGEKDIEDYIRKRDKEKKRRREDRLVNKMKDLITVVGANDLRWTTYTLAPLYQFIRRPDIEVITCFFHKDDKKLLFPDSGLDDDDGGEEDGIGGKKTKGTTSSTVTKSVTSVSSQLSQEPSGTKETVKKEAVVKNLRRSKGWQRMSFTTGTDGQSLIVLNDVVPNNSVDLFYFVKLKPLILDKDNFFENVSFGNVPGGHLTTLHSLLSYVYGPMFQTPGVLPESIQNEFYAGLTSLISAIAETTDRMDTLASEANRMPTDMASKTKELAARLEKIDSMIDGYLK